MVFLVILSWTKNIQNCVILRFRGDPVKFLSIQVDLQLSSTCSHWSSGVHVVKVLLILRLREDGVHELILRVRRLVA